MEHRSFSIEYFQVSVYTIPKKNYNTAKGKHGTMLGLSERKQGSKTEFVSKRKGKIL